MKNPPSCQSKFALDTFDDVSTKLSQNMHRDLGRIKLSYKSNPTALKRYMTAQKSAYLKKYIGFDEGESEDEKEMDTFKKFLFINQHMAEFSEVNLNLPDDRRSLCSLSIRSDILLRARLIVRSILTPFSEEEFLKECKHSGGTSIGVPYHNTSVENKLTFPISCTERAIPLLTSYLAWDKTHAEAIQNLNSEFPKRDKLRIVEGSRATTVPKSDTIRRMIAIEPTGNMFLQQGLMTMIVRRLKLYGLDIAFLPYEHSKLAFRASITGKLATIDFTSASDCVQRDLLRWLIPPNWFRTLQNVSSERIKINDAYVDTHMFSTMGNAGTFPLEMLVFYSLGMACHLRHYNAPSSFPEMEDRKRVSVFGDDCILDTDVAPLFIEVAESVGFIVNKEKSFFSNKPGFRESCGSDYYRGVDVRPLYFKEPHTHRMSDFEPWLYICMNKIIKKYILCFGDLSYLYEKRVFKQFRDLCVSHGIKVKLVPRYFPADSGLKIAYDVGRFRRLYPEIEFSEVSKNKHNQYTFYFCNFQYAEEGDRHDFVQYSLWQKKPLITDPFVPCREPEDMYTVKKRGGYVVAKALTSFWEEPPI